jgi:hypothetical protein
MRLTTNCRGLGPMRAVGVNRRACWALTFRRLLQRTDMFRIHESSLKQHLQWLDLNGKNLQAGLTLSQFK